MLRRWLIITETAHENQSSIAVAYQSKTYDYYGVHDYISKPTYLTVGQRGDEDLCFISIKITDYSKHAVDIFSQDRLRNDIIKCVSLNNTFVFV